MEAPAEIKVKTRKFSLTKGTIKISFERKNPFPEAETAKCSAGYKFSF